jgi:uncharacterized membrane protein YedE/YeeE
MAWPAAALVLAVVPAQSARGKAVRLLIWIAAAAWALGLYLHGYVVTSTTRSTFVALQHPVSFVRYAFTHLGAPLAPFSPGLALAIGVGGVALALGMIIYFARNRRDYWQPLLPFLGMEAFAVGIALLTALARTDEGPRQALSSRYITWSTFFWTGLVCQLYGFLQPDRTQSGRDAPARSYLVRWLARVAPATPSLIAMLVVLSTAWGGYCADERHDAFVLGRNALVTGANLEDLRFLYPRPESLGPARELLREHRLSVFRKVEGD